VYDCEGKLVRELAAPVPEQKKVTKKFLELKIRTSRLLTIFD